MSQTLWGIDLGGTKIEGVILPGLDRAEPLIRTRIPSESAKGYKYILDQVLSLVNKMKAESGLTPERIGFGTPGITDPIFQTMKNCNSTALNGKPLKTDLENLLGLEVVLENDANCFALAETKWGVVNEKTPGARMVFGIIMGTGTGAGIVYNGQIWPGKQGIGGEWGHNILDESGGPCYCGKSGCVETVISGPGTEKFYTSITGKKLKLDEIYSLYLQDSDPAAVKTIERLCYYFGKAVSVVVNILDPDVIVIGGGVGNIKELYSLGRKSLEKYVFNNRLDTPILAPSLGDSAGVFGAAALVAPVDETL